MKESTVPKRASNKSARQPQAARGGISSKESLPVSGRASSKNTMVYSLISGKITTEEISHLARRGVSAQVIGHMVQEKAATVKSVAYVLGINERTVRTYQREESNLSPQQSEQLLKYNRLLNRGKEVFGSEETFDRWLHKPAYGLDNEIPLDFLVTSEGINLVSDELERIANGEFA